MVEVAVVPTAPRPSIVGRVATRGIALVALALDSLVLLLIAGSLPAIAHAFHVPLDAAGLIFTANGTGFTVAVPLSGALADRFGKRAIAAGNALAFGTGLLFLAASRDLAAALAAATLAGAGGGSIESSVTALLPEMYPGREGFANNFAQAFFGLGATLGPLLLLAPTLGWRMRLALCGAALLAVAAGFWRERAQDERPQHAAAPSPWSPGLRMLRNPGIGASVAAMILYTGVEVAVWGWLFTVVTRPGGAGPVWAVAELSGFWCAMGAGRLLAGMLAERVDLTLLIAVETLAGVPALLLTLLAHSRAGALAAVILCGLAFSGIWPSIVGHAQKHHGESALLASVLVAAGGAGALAVPAAFGFAIARLGLRAAAVGLAFLLAPVAFLPFLASARGRRPGRTLPAAR